MAESVDNSMSLLQAAQQIIGDVGASRILVFLDGLPPSFVASPEMVLLIRGGELEEQAKKLKRKYGCTILDIPNVKLDRAGQINLAALLALSRDVIKDGDAVIALVGAKGKSLDMLQIISPNEEFNLVKALGKGRSKKAVRRVVFQRVIAIALELSTEGREGKAVGSFFVVGDNEKVEGHTEQLIMNPFRGYPEDMRSILDNRMGETVKEFSTIDGAIIIRGDGVVMSAGTLVRAALVDEDLPKGLGSRHASAAGITRITNAVAVTVSESDGTVRIWRQGKIVTALERE